MAEGFKPTKAMKVEAERAIKWKEHLKQYETKIYQILVF